MKLPNFSRISTGKTECSQIFKSFPDERPEKAVSLLDNKLELVEQFLRHRDTLRPRYLNLKP